MGRVKEFWAYFKGDKSHFDATANAVRGETREINNDIDAQRLNLLILKRVASEIFSAIIRTQQGTWAANVASIAQSAISAKISYSLLHAQAAGAFLQGNIIQGYLLEGLAAGQLALSIYAMGAEQAAKAQKQNTEDYMAEVNSFREMYS